MIDVCVKWILLPFLFVFTVALLLLLRWAAKKDREAWTRKMEKIDRDHSAKLCTIHAQYARRKMQIRAAKRMFGLNDPVQPPD